MFNHFTKGWYKTPQIQIYKDLINKWIKIDFNSDTK